VWFGNHQQQKQHLCFRVEIILICQQPGMLPVDEAAINKESSVALLV
jgi:hypothetical protein